MPTFSFYIRKKLRKSSRLAKLICPKLRTDFGFILDVQFPMSWVCARNLSRVWDKWVLLVCSTQSNNQLNPMSWAWTQNLSLVWNKWALRIVKRINLIFIIFSWCGNWKLASKIWSQQRENKSFWIVPKKKMQKVIRSPQKVLVGNFFTVFFPVGFPTYYRGNISILLHEIFLCVSVLATWMGMRLSIKSFPTRWTCRPSLSMIPWRRCTIYRRTRRRPSPRSPYKSF